ncbi:MAG TPA: hypothetical protein VK550_01365 [Polyangiaceae bacterium]|nr:hypothetical protein [Polyangiaceae bacterium]
MNNVARWRGAVALVRDAVEHGSRAVQRIQIESARRPFGILERIPGVAEPTRVVHGVHDASVTAVHEAIRGVNVVVGATIDFALRRADKGSD